MQRPPTRINVFEKSQFGIPVRAWIILAIAALAAGATFFGVLPLGLFWSAPPALLIAGLGFALAFGEIDGQKPERWLLNVLSFKRRARYMVKGAQAQAAETRVAVAAEPAPTPPPAPQPRPAAKARPAPSFFVLSGSALSLAVLTGLTLYLAGGGAARLLSLAQHL